MNDIIPILTMIHDRLKYKRIKWMLGGSASLFLHGTVEKVGDIDILTDKEGAFKICEVFKEHIIKPVQFRESRIMRSYWGQLKIRNVKIDVMGDFCEKIKGKWINISHKRLSSPEFKRINNVRIPVSSLKHHLESYKVLGRKKDAEKIKMLEERLR